MRLPADEHEQQGNGIFVKYFLTGSRDQALPAAKKAEPGTRQKPGGVFN